MAQLGRALRSGRRGRRFKSCRIDEKKVPPLGGTFFSFVSLVSEPVFQCITAESQFAAGKFIQHPVASEPATSIEADARSGAEGSRGPGDLGFEPTGAKRRTQVQILSHR